MGQAHLARARRRASAHQARVADGVVRRPKRPLRDQRATRREPARDRMNLGHLHGLREGERGKDTREPTGQHGLSGPGRAQQQQVVGARGSHFQGPLHVLLTLHVADTRSTGWAFGEHCVRIHTGGREARIANQVPDELTHGAGADHVEALKDGGLPGVLIGQDQAGQPGFPARERDRKRPSDRPKAPVQSEFADRGVAT